MDNRKPQGRSKFGAKKSSPFKKDSSERPKRSFSKEGGERSFDKPKRATSDRAERPSYSDKPKRNFSTEGNERSSERPKRATSDRPERPSYSDKPKRSFSKEGGERSTERLKRATSGRSERPSYSDKPKRSSFERGERAPYADNPKRSFDTDGTEEKPKRGFADRGERAKHYANKNEKSQLKRSSFERGERAAFDPSKPKNYKKDYSKKKEATVTNADKGLTRLNKYIANAGICSRREADDLIKSGCVTVNGKVISELGYTVKATDEVNYSGARLKTEKNVYLLLNKPKDYITTAADERGRKTVMELITGACKERIYPVGRLDRNTTGLLLFTNDGDMTKKLTHPKHEVEKLYHVELDKNLKQDDFEKIREGVELEDGFIQPDELSYTGETKREVGIKIHSGRNRIVRRLFEHMGYDVLRLDRVMFAGLTKKNIPRAKWRFLTDKEVSFLKMLK